MEVFFVGLKNAPFLQSVLGEYGIKSFTMLGWNIDGLNIDEFAGFEDKAIRLAKFKIFTAAAEVLRKSNMSNVPAGPKLYIGFHTIASFQNEELNCVRTQEELSQMLKRLRNHSYSYYAAISVGVTDENGQMKKIQRKCLIVYPTIANMSDDEIYKFVKNISDEKIFDCSFNYRPLTSEIKDVVEGVEVEGSVFTNALKVIIREIFAEIGVNYCP
ncbi:MAG: hypothetical protein WCF93_03685 [Candidatus Moraniibacteriota bacterium]